MLRRMGNLPLTIAHRIGRKFKPSLATDCTQCAANAASTIESHLSNRAPKEAWRALKGWYRVVEDCPAPACLEMMEKQMAKRMELYAWAPPMGVALSFNFPQLAIPDGVPTDEEKRAVVVGLKNGQAAGATGMFAEHIKGWLGDFQSKEKVIRENPSQTWENLKQVVDLCSDDPDHMGLGRNPNADELDGHCTATKGWRQFKGDRPAGPLLESSEKIMVRRMGAIEFNPYLHGGLPKQGTGTATIEAKLAQQLAWLEQEPLFQVFVDLRKA